MCDCRREEMILIISGKPIIEYAPKMRITNYVLSPTVRPRYMARQRAVSIVMK